MSKQTGKRMTAALAEIDTAKSYDLREAIGLVKSISKVKFDETVEIALKLGVDPRQADQMVRGTVVLPHGLGKSRTVLVIASGEKVKEAEEAGADMVGGEEYVEKIQKGFMEFDTVISTPDMMKSVGKLGRILGPRGLMTGVFLVPCALTIICAAAFLIFFKEKKEIAV